VNYNVAAPRYCDESGLPRIKREYAIKTWSLDVMKLRNVSLVLFSLGLASIALAGEEMKTRMAITMVDDDSNWAVRLDLDSDDLGFNLHDMQEGENRSIVDKSGRNILVTREADGYKFDVEGKTIKMPLFAGQHHGAVLLGDYDVSIADAHSMNGVMIVSEKPIDEATQQAIKSMLESTGHGSEVRFIDASATHGGPHMFKVIEKKAELMN
jgi:hypothetical protein